MLNRLLYYISPSVAFIFYAFIRGWRNLIRVAGYCVDRWGGGQKTRIHSGAMGMVLSGILIANIFFGLSPLSLQFWLKNLRPAPFNTQNHHYTAYIITDHHRKAKEFEKLIPDSAIVSAQHFLHSSIFMKKAIMIYPQLESIDGKIKADYVFFDKTNNGLKKGSPAYLSQWKFDIVEKNGKDWELVKYEDEYHLYKR